MFMDFLTFHAKDDKEIIIRRKDIVSIQERNGQSIIRIEKFSLNKEINVKESVSEIKTILWEHDVYVRNNTPSCNNSPTDFDII